MSKPPSTYTSSRPGSIRTFTNTIASSSSLKQDPPHEGFVYQNGSRLHGYDRAVAPYPFNYDRQTLELYAIDRSLIFCTKGACSFLNFEGKAPKRCLDLATGLGDWCVDAAKTWTESTFVGYDLVDVQVDLQYVEPSVANRIEWMHGNFLTERLPFDDNEFDFVHIFGIGLSVPEDKWHCLYDEIYRVLKPGGHIEQLEEDALFPVLPRWFTAPLHNQAKRSNPQAQSSARSTAMLPKPPEELPHDHALLEKLFNSIFENRFVNATPSSILPGYFSATFTHVVSPPILFFPAPPLAPLPPFPGETNSLPSAPPVVTEVVADHRQTSMLPPVIPPIPSHTQIREFLPPRVDAAREHNKLSKPFLERERGLQRVSSLSTISSTGKDSQKSSSSGKSSKQSGGSVVLPALAEEGQTTQIGGAAAYELFAMEELGELDECSLFLHMHRAASLVYAAKESMWDELMDMVVRSDNALRRYGWKDEDYTEKATRNKFEALWERYKADIRVRASLWYPMTHYGWSYPRQDPLTKAELADEDRLRQAILEARNHAREEEIQPGLRSIRLLIGMKGS